MTFNKIFLSFYFIFSFTPLFWRGAGGEAFSQVDSTRVPKTQEQAIEFYGDAYVASNAISNNFISAFYQGKFIDEGLKDNTSKQMHSSNILGGISKIGFTYTYQSLNGRNKPVFSFSFFDRTNLDVKFSDDLFHAVFYGNKSFAGETAQLGNFKYTLLRYQQFRFGWKWNGDNHHGSYGFAFSLLNGEQNIFAKANTADLYTSPDGQFMNIALAMKMKQTDTAHTKYFAQNGMGISTDFFYEAPYLVWDNPGKLTLEVSDLGFIRWNSNSMKHSVDSTFHYEGINVNDILNANGGTIPKINGDSIINKNTIFERKQYTTSLPFYFNVRTKTFYGKQFAFEKGITFLFNSSAKPYCFLKLHFITKRQNAEIIYVAGYGGYGKFNTGVELRIAFAKYYSIHIADNYLFSGSVQESYGQGLYLKLSRKF